MKLIMCLKCADIFNLSLNRKKTCYCGQASGICLNEKDIQVEGEYAVIGFHNQSFIDAARRNKHNRSGMGEEFKAFFIPEDNQSIIKK
jgi:hypothetical protein